MIPHALKKHVFVLLLAVILLSALLGHGAVAAATALGLLAWLGLETHERRRFAFVARRACPEHGVDMGAPIEALAVSQAAPLALLVQAQRRVSLLDLDSGRLRWTRQLDAGALALLARPDGGLIWAGEDRLHWSAPDGSERASLAFEAPLYRQSYRLLLSADGGQAFLHTPWFIQAFDPDLKALGPRLRYEDAGHYMKYAALSADGRRLYTAGALLLEDPEEGSGAAMEARWDAWDLRLEGWVNAWKRSYESYNNSHLRGLSLSADGSLLCAELWQEGYEFHLFDPQGQLVWKRAGEHPVLSPDGALLLWESRFEGVVLSRVADQQALHGLKAGDKPRLKAVADDGSRLLVAGSQILILDPQGGTRWQAWFKADPESLGLGPGGRLVVTHGGRAAVLRLPWQG